ncbi:DNA cytosine methyltransferase [candidate division KSB1 bacterium]
MGDFDKTRVKYIGDINLRRKITFLDLFAGGGGLSEGFIRAGFKPIAHVEVDQASCYSLKTRSAYHYLNYNNKLNYYSDYLSGNITRNEYYSLIPSELIESVINLEIGEKNNPEIFNRVDRLLNGKKLDLIIGGPPCQAYSLVGRARDKNGMKGDRRNYLYEYYADFLRYYKPECFIFENVTGLLSAVDCDNIPFLEKMKILFRKIGYITSHSVLSAKDYGIPQNRKRLFIFGSKDSGKRQFPEPDKINLEGSAYDYFKDLPEIKAGEGTVRPTPKIKSHSRYLAETGINDTNGTITFQVARPHNKQDLSIYRIAVQKWNEKRERLDYNDLPSHLKTHKNINSFRDRFKVVVGDLPYSHTIVAHIAKDGHYYIHPDIEQNRSLTPREAARLQTFPDSYFFESISENPGKTAAYKQIGNAVPVLLAQKIAEKLREVF